MATVSNAGYLNAGVSWERNLEALSNGALMCEEEAKARMAFDGFDANGKSNAALICAATLVAVGILLGITLHKSGYAFVLVGVGIKGAVGEYVKGQKEALSIQVRTTSQSTAAVCSSVQAALKDLHTSTLKESAKFSNNRGYSTFREMSSASAESNELVKEWRTQSKSDAAQKYRQIQEFLRHYPSYPKSVEAPLHSARLAARQLLLGDAAADTRPMLGSVDSSEYPSYHRITQESYGGSYRLDVPK